MEISNDKAEENGASVLIRDGIQESFGEEAACDLGLRTQKDYTQW